MMMIDEPSIVLDATGAFMGYEAALLANDLNALDSFFWSEGRTIRYGVAENLYGIEAIRAFRSGRSPVGLDRALSRTVITTFGQDLATASTLFTRNEPPGRIGRQQQTWVRFADGWKIVAAHVSLIPA